MKAVASDTTSLIALEGLQSLELLCETFDGVLIPNGVLSELSAGSPDVIETIANISGLEIVQLKPSKKLTHLQLILDQGEAEAIALALERQLPILIDERKGRAIAQQQRLVVIGFAGVLLLAVKRNILPPKAAIEMLDQAITNGFRLSTQLYQQICLEIRKH